MTKDNFLLWVKIQSLDLGKERIAVDSRSRNPEICGAVRLKNGQWHFYDNSGTYTEFKGSERKVFSRLQEILSARIQARNKGRSIRSATLRELYAWAEEYGLLDMPIRVEGRPYPSSVSIQRIAVADSQSKGVTYLSI